MANFVGRKQELVLLQRFCHQKAAAFIVVRGRRRIGKSRLIQEFAKPHQFYRFSGIPPHDKTTAQSQRDEFSSQLAQQGFPNVRANDWNDLFWMLAEKTQKGKVVILLDEISWMGSEDADFLGKLKNAWDLHFKNNPQLALIICGSASSWIEKNILSHTGFVGRIGFTLTLEGLPLEDCQAFWGKQANQVSAQEKFKMLSVTGGVPRYLEAINPALSADENIRNLCFTQGALLVNEFNHIFSHIFLRDSAQYIKIVQCLATGSKTFREVTQALKLENTGRILEYLNELMLAGFIKRDYTWNLSNAQDSKLSKFRLSDNYLRFYLKYIRQRHTQIDRGSFNVKSLHTLPGWDTIMALQFENLVLNNRHYIHQKLGLKPEDIMAENPFFQNKTTKQQGCQIDYLIQTKCNTLYICEIKCSKNPVSHTVIDSVREKIKRLKSPRYVSHRPVLIHINGVDDQLQDSDYFMSMIDFSRVFS